MPPPTPLVPNGLALGLRERAVWVVSAVGVLVRFGRLRCSSASPYGRISFMTLTVPPMEMTSWQQLQGHLANYDHQWAFRGMGTASWALQTSLERLAISPVVEAERYLLTAFRRRAHHHVRDCPDPEDYLEWLALMQHHGAPTRLLDWTRSPYVALFFAIERPGDENGKAAVWAIDIDACKKSALSLLVPLLGNQDAVISLGKPDIFKNAFMTEHDSSSPATVKCVSPIQPFRMNERLTTQQGLFLCPAQVSTGFEANLGAMSHSGTKIEKIVFPCNLRQQILAELSKMNISRASLFPGIDGFAQSLAVNVEIATSKGKLSQEIKRLDRYAEYGF